LKAPSQRQIQNPRPTAALLSYLNSKSTSEWCVLLDQAPLLELDDNRAKGCPAGALILLL
jgi:hypothetical protein